MNATIFSSVSLELAGNTLFVDPVYGPYKTLGAAQAAAVSGQLIYVRPGTYSVADSILKNGVNWYFEAGSEVAMPMSVVGTTGILDDKGVAITSNVSGEGDFLRTITDSGDYVGCCRTNNAATVLNVHARNIGCVEVNSATNAGTPVGALQQLGTLFVECSESIYGIDGTGNFDEGIGVYWDQGNGFIEAPKIFATQNAVFFENSGSASDEFHVTAQEMYCTGAAFEANIYGVVFGGARGSNANAAIWIHADIIQGGAGSGYASVYATPANVNKCYSTTQKLFGYVSSGGGLMYVTSEKIEAIANVSTDPLALFVICAQGTLRYNVRQHDPKAFTGIGFLVNGGTIISNEIEYTSGSGSDGMTISSGTARLNTALLSTAANSSGFPITKSGGTLALTACRIISNGSVASIQATTAQNVSVLASGANNLANVNVTNTIAGGLIVSAGVI